MIISTVAQPPWAVVQSLSTQSVLAVPPQELTDQHEATYEDDVMDLLHSVADVREHAVQSLEKRAHGKPANLDAALILKIDALRKAMQNADTALAVQAAQ